MQNVIKSIKEKKGTLLDVRSVMEFEENHIPFYFLRLIEFLDLL